MNQQELPDGRIQAAKPVWVTPVVEILPVAETANGQPASVADVTLSFRTAS